MPQQIEFEGVLHEFPDDFSPAEISMALGGGKPPAAPPVPAGLPNDVPAPPIATDQGNVNWTDPGYQELTAPRQAPEGPRPLSATKIGPGLPSLRDLQVGVQGVGRGLAETPIVPLPFPPFVAPGPGAGDILSAVYNAAADSWELPKAGYLSEEISDIGGMLMEAAGIKPLEPKDMSGGERIGYEVGRMGSSATAGGAGLAKRALNVARSPFPTKGDAFLDPYRTSATKALATDTAAGAGSGVTTGVYNETVPEEDQGVLGRLIAGLVGGLGGASTAAIAQKGGKAAVDTGKRMVEGWKYDPEVARDAETGTPFTRRAVDDASRYMQDRAADPKAAKANIEENQQFYKESDLPEPTLGSLSNDTGLIGVDRTAREIEPTPFMERDRALRSAQSGKMEKLGPDLPEGERRAAQRFAETEAGQMRAQSADQTAKVTNELTAKKGALDQAAEQGDSITAPVRVMRGREATASAALDKEVTENTLLPLTGKKNAAMDAIDPERTVQRDAQPFLATAKQIKDQIGALTPERSGVPAEFVTKIEMLAAKDTIDAGTSLETGVPQISKAGGTGKVALGDVADVRKQLSTAADKAQQAGNYELAGNLRKLKSEVNAELDRAIAEGGPGSAEAALAKKIYEEEYAPFFATGYGKAFRDKVFRDPAGVENRTQLPPSKVAAFFLDNTEEAAAHLKRIVDIAPNKEAAAAAVENYYKARLATSLPSSKEMTPGYLRDWIDANKGLSQFPEIKAKFEALHKDVLNNRQQRNALMSEINGLEESVRAAKLGEAQTERLIQTSILGTFLDNNPENAVGAILASGGDPEKRMAEAIKLVDKDRSGRARQALKAAVREHLNKRLTGTSVQSTADESLPVLQSKFENLMKDKGVRNALNALYKDDPAALKAMADAQRIARDMARINIQAKAGSATSENEARRAKWMRPLEIAIKSTYGGLRGGNIMRNIRLAIATLPGMNDDAAVQALVLKASLDGDTAKLLLGRDVTKLPGKVWTKKLNRLINYGVAARSADDEQEEK